jgi:hypothetical protein
VKRKENPPQCFVWFSNGLGSSQNSLIHNWCIGGCWVTQQAEKNTISFSVAHCVFVDEVYHPIPSFYVEFLNSGKSKPRQFLS